LNGECSHTLCGGQSDRCPSSVPRPLAILLADKPVAIDGNLILTGIHIQKFESAIVAGCRLVLRTATAWAAGLLSTATASTLLPTASTLLPTAPALLLKLRKRRLWKLPVSDGTRIDATRHRPQRDRGFSNRLSAAGSQD
jgi:hypothetical protein